MISQRLAQLDRALVTRGEHVVLRRGHASEVTITCRARMKGHEAKPLVGNIAQDDSTVIMSPSAILATPLDVWPGEAGGDRFPQRGDFITARGRTRAVLSAETLLENGQAVRVELKVRG